MFEVNLQSTDSHRSRLFIQTQNNLVRSGAQLRPTDDDLRPEPARVVEARVVFAIKPAAIKR